MPAQLYSADFPDIDAAVAAAISTKTSLRLAPGTHTPTIPIVLSTGRPILDITGIAADAVKVDCSALTGAWIFTDRRLGCIKLSGIDFIAPNGPAFSQLSTQPNTPASLRLSITECVFHNGQVALAIQTPDSPHMTIEDCAFYGTSDSARGVVVRGNPTNVRIRENQFVNQLFGIACASDGGGYFKFKDNEFFAEDNRPAAPLTHIWLIPGEPNDGRGGLVEDNKFGGENAQPNDIPVLIADSSDPDVTTGLPVLARSTGGLRLIRFVNNVLAQPGSNAFIVSRTPSLSQFTVQTINYNNNRPSIGSGKDALGADVLTVAEVTAMLEASVPLPTPTSGTGDGPIDSALKLHVDSLLGLAEKQISKNAPRTTDLTQVAADKAQQVSHWTTIRNYTLGYFDL